MICFSPSQKISSTFFPNKQPSSFTVSILNRGDQQCMPWWGTLTDNSISISTLSCITQKFTFSRVVISSSLVTSQSTVKVVISRKQPSLILKILRTSSTSCLQQIKRLKTRWWIIFVTNVLGRKTCEKI